MGATSLLGIPLALARRRWLMWLPLAMTLCGALAFAPDLVVRRGDLSRMFDFAECTESDHPHPRAMDALFLHRWLDGQDWLDSRDVTDLGFQAVAFLYLVAACGYAGWIRWGLPRMAEAPEALARLRQAAAGYRPLIALVGVVPLLAAGAAVGWIVRTTQPPPTTAPLQEWPDPGAWARLVSRRLRLDPGPRLGIVQAAWDSSGAWLAGDLGVATPGGGAAGRDELIEHARANGCGFIVVSDPADVAEARPTPSDIAVISGSTFDVPLPGGAERLAVLGIDHAWSRFSTAEAALRWLGAHDRSALVFSAAAAGPGAGREELFSWLRTNERFAGILGLAGAERVSAREARSQWDPRVARVGDAWDQLLDRGFRLWGAAAASGFRDPAKHFWPGEFARTHAWCRGPTPEDVMEALRRGCFWADEGRIVRALDFEVVASALERPARMGEVARVAPGDEVAVQLALDVPPTDFAGRENRIGQVEFISNFDGEPKVVATFHHVASGQRLDHTFPPAEDRNGGVGFYVRARGWRADDGRRPSENDGRRPSGGGPRLSFYTNPIRILVRPGAPAPASQAPPLPQMVQRPEQAPPPEPSTSLGPGPTTAHGVAPAPPGAGDKLQAIGLPRSVRPALIETFQDKVPRSWRGLLTANVGDRGPAMGDDDLRIELLQRVPLGAATRLFFRCYAQSCRTLTLTLRTSFSSIPFQLVRALPERQWTELDLSIDGDFLPVRGAPARLQPPTALEAVEWRAEGLGPLARFYVADFALYEPTPASRQELVQREAERAKLTVDEVAAEETTPTARRRAAELASRLGDCRARLGPTAGQLPPEALAALERELAEAAEDCRRLRLQGAMARAFGLPDPQFAVSVAGPAERFSAHRPAGLSAARVSSVCELAGAAGEAESFQVLVAALWDGLRGVEVTATDLVPTSGTGPALPASEIAAARVDEVQVRPRPGLMPEQAGWVPDPLAPLAPFDVEPGSLRAVLLTIPVRPDLVPGSYEGYVLVRPAGLDAVQVKVRLRRWDFSLSSGHFPVIGPLDEKAIRDHYHYGDAVPRARRRELYELLLRHRVEPVPLLTGQEEADIGDVTFCLSRGSSLAVLHETSAEAPRGNDPGVARAARYAAKLWDAGWGRCGALLVRRASGATVADRTTAAVNALGRESPGLLIIAGGDGEPPPDLVTHYWRRPIGQEAPRLPAGQDIEVRLSRTARREAWELVAATPGSALPNLLLTSPLIDGRVLPWLAWRHGVRALLLYGVTRWGQDDAGAGVLVHPGAGTHPCASLRLVALRDGVEDYECLWLAWERVRQLRERAPERQAALVTSAERVLADATGGIGSFDRPCRDPRILASLRADLARTLEALEAAWWAETDAADDLPPPPPDVAAQPGDGEVALTWVKSPDEKANAYDVFRSCDPQRGFVRVNSRPIDALRYVDRAVRNGVEYHYFVRACRDKTADGPRSRIVAATPRPTPSVAWLPMADLTQGSVGPYRVTVRLEGPGTGGLLPLVRPQIDFALSDGALDGFEDMVRQDDGRWTFDVPDLGWRQSAAKELRLAVRIVDRRGQAVAPPVERIELIDPVAAPKK